MSCEAALRLHFDAYDGSKKNISEVDQLFNAVSHERYTLVMSGNTFYRDAAGYLARGSKVELVDLRRIDADRIDKFERKTKKNARTST
jgi:hypothetical protein